MRYIEAILGHKKLDTTELYSRVVVEELREVLARAATATSGYVAPALDREAPIRTIG